jgi:hypothetical protein
MIYDLSQALLFALSWTQSNLKSRILVTPQLRAFAFYSSAFNPEPTNANEMKAKSTKGNGKLKSCWNETG